MLKKNPLSRQYPLLSALAYLSLGKWPTPLFHAQSLGIQFGISYLYFKQEGDAGGFDVTGKKLFGGNKVRKLEFLLADVLQKKYKTVLTCGGIASNHVAATAAYAQQCGLHSIGLLMDQPITDNLKRNLLLSHSYGCKLFAVGNDLPTQEQLRLFLEHNKCDENPYIIPMGGSNILGVIGQVNALFELTEQIDAGVMPEPDYIYVAMGSMATAAGLLLGIKVAGLKTKVKAVRVTDNPQFDRNALCALIQETNIFLHAMDSSFLLFDWVPKEFCIVENFIGAGYAHNTIQAHEARELFQKTENCILDTTYTAKAAAALIDDCRNKRLKSDDTILFWNTYCSDSYEDILSKVDYRNLAVIFHKYLRS